MVSVSLQHSVKKPCKVSHNSSLKSVRGPEDSWIHSLYFTNRSSASVRMSFWVTYNPSAKPWASLKCFRSPPSLNFSPCFPQRHWEFVVVVREAKHCILHSISFLYIHEFRCKSLQVHLTFFFKMSIYFWLLCIGFYVINGTSEWLEAEI